MAASYKTSRRVEFSDTDAAGIMHFSKFFDYMEQTEHEWLRQLGLSVMTDGPEGRISWPRVHASCDFQTAVRFEDKVQIEIQVDRLGKTSVTYRVRFWQDDCQIAEGKLTAVCCRLSEDVPPQPIAIPDEFTQKLSA